VLGFTAGVGVTLAAVAALTPPGPDINGLHAAQKGKGGADPGKTPERQFLARDDAEKRIMDVLEDLDKNQRPGHMNVPVEDGRLLRILAEAIGAKHVVEIGTSNGYSGTWFCLALRNTGGKLTTHEINAKRAALARENFKRAGVERLVTIVEGDAHKTVTSLKEPIDLLFLDADPAGYVDYMKKIGPLVRPGGLIVTHNVQRPPPDPKWIEQITTRAELNTVFLNMHAAGIAVTLKRK
jgi:predicted O-methyltransferase YrrM